VAPEIKLVAFLVLAVAIFLGAHAAGALVGPVTSVNAPAGGSSGSVHSGGMNMGLGHLANRGPDRP
jgi:hypothetical protein